MKTLTFRTDILPLKDQLFRIALRITMNRQDAEDVVQETMLRLWKQRERWQQISSIEAFANTICRNLALDLLQRADNKASSLEEELTKEKSVDPYETMNQKEQLQIVHDMMAQLPEKQRTCMQLRDFEGKTYKEIAEIMNITEDQVKVNIFRARKSVKQKIDEL